MSAEFSTKLGFSFATRLGRNLELLRNAVLKQDFDAAIIVDGKEGAGKSVLAMQVAHFLDVDREININTQLCYTPQQFQRAIRTLPPGKAIVWDEARRGVNRRRSMEGVNLDITDMLAECRQRNLFMVIVMPSFYDMDLNVAMHRTRALIHVWYKWNVDKRDEPLERGYFRFYNEEGKADLYTNKILRAKYKYPFIKNKCFDNTFPNHYVVNETEYRKRKRESENYWKDQQPLSRELVGRVLWKLQEACIIRHGDSQKIGEVFGVTHTTIRNWILKAKNATITYNTVKEKEE